MLGDCDIYVEDNKVVIPMHKMIFSETYTEHPRVPPTRKPTHEYDCKIQVQSVLHRKSEFARVHGLQSV